MISIKLHFQNGPDDKIKRRIWLLSSKVFRRCCTHVKDKNVDINIKSKGKLCTMEYVVSVRETLDCAQI